MARSVKVLLLKSQHNLIHIFGVSETKLNQIYPNTEFEIHGYRKTFTRDRKENADGGVLVYIKNGISCSRRPDLEHERLECWSQIKPPKSKLFPDWPY